MFFSGREKASAHSTPQLGGLVECPPRKFGNLLPLRLLLVSLVSRLPDLFFAHARKRGSPVSNVMCMTWQVQWCPMVISEHLAKNDGCFRWTVIFERYFINCQPSLAPLVKYKLVILINTHQTSRGARDQVTLEDVIARYLSLIGCKPPTLAVKLAKEAFFGENIMKQCTPLGERELPGLPTVELGTLKVPFIHTPLSIGPMLLTLSQYGPIVLTFG